MTCHSSSKSLSVLWHQWSWKCTYSVKSKLSEPTVQLLRGKWFSAQTHELPSLLQKLLMLLRTAQVCRNYLYTDWPSADWAQPVTACKRRSSGFGYWHQADHLQWTVLDPSKSWLYTTHIPQNWLFQHHELCATPKTPGYLRHQSEIKVPQFPTSLLCPCTLLRSHTTKQDQCSNWKSSFPGRVETKQPGTP